MFMGFMNLGLSFMLLFFGIITVAVFLNMEYLIVFNGVVWFYAFFDCINKRFSTDEAFERFEDRFLFVDNMPFKPIRIIGKRHAAVGAVVIFIGLYMLFNNLVSWFRWTFSEEVYQIISSIMYRLPQLASALVIIGIGFWLISGKKKELEKDVQES